MRAAVLRAYNADLAIETLPDPACEADGVVLRTLACGVCRSDWHGWTGEHPRVKPGQIPGHEYCGEVVEAGPLARLARRRPGGGAVHPRLRPLPGLPVGQPEHLPRPAAAGLRRAGRLRRARRGAASPTTSRRLPEAHDAGGRRRARLPRHHRLARADRAGRPPGRRMAGDPRHRRRRPLGDADRQGARRPRGRRRRRAREARPRARPRRRRRGRRPGRRRRRGDPRADRRRRRTSRSRRSGSPRPPTPRSSACARSAATSRSGCRSATPRAWRST